MSGGKMTANWCVRMQAHKESKSMKSNEVKKEHFKQTEHFDSD